MNRQTRRILQALGSLHDVVKASVDKWEIREKRHITPAMEMQIAVDIMPCRYRELIMEWNLNKDEQYRISAEIKKRLNIDLTV
jgi:hypothetical protein